MGQGRHDADERLEPVLYDPGKQGMHEDADASPALLLHVPLGQGTAAAAPPVQYAPTGQRDPAGEDDPGAHANPAIAVHGAHWVLFVDAAKVPALHGRHDAREERPVTALNVPSGHGVMGVPGGQ